MFRFYTIIDFFLIYIVNTNMFDNYNHKIVEINTVIFIKVILDDNSYEKSQYLDVLT